GLCPEELELTVMRGVIAKVVEPRFPDRHGLRVADECRELIDLRFAHRASLVRMEAERDKNSGLPFGKGQHRAAGVERRPDGDDPVDSRFARASKRLRRVIE